MCVSKLFKYIFSLFIKKPFTAKMLTVCPGTDFIYTLPISKINVSTQ